VPEPALTAVDQRCSRSSGFKVPGVLPLHGSPRYRRACRLLVEKMLPRLIVADTLLNG